MARPIGIRIHRGSDLLDTQVFERDIIKIGRLASAHLRLEDPKVSRIHAVIEVADNKEAAIIDMGSAEGTRVNGEKVSRVRLKHGDEIGLGDSRLLVVLDEAELQALKGEGVAVVAAATNDADPSVTDITRAVMDLPLPTGLTNGNVFQTGSTDVTALRAELQAAVPAPVATDVFNSSGIDVALESLAPRATSQPPRGAPSTPPAAARPSSVPAAPAAAAAPAPARRAPPPIPAPSIPPMMASILPPLPPIAEDSITPENRYIEVTLRWGGTVTDVKRLKSVPKFRVGKSSTDDLFVPVEGGSFNLLTSQAGQGWKVRFKDGMSGNVTRGEHSAPLASSGAVPDGDAMAVPLTDDTVVTIGLGYHSLQVRAVPKSRVVPIIPFFDALWANAALVTLFAAAAMLSTVIFYPVGMDSLEDDLLTNPTKFQTLILKPPPKDNAFLNKLKGPKADKPAVAKESGKAGDKKADPKKDQGRMASKAPDKPTDEQVVAGKMAALFGGDGAVGQLFGGDASGGALEAALGGLNGGKVASGYGTGGLGLRGGGPGGGGVGTGTLGSGKIGTRGRGSGETGYGSGEGGLGKKSERDITMTTGTPVILGSLDPEIIRRIVREHAGQIRYCYESELSRTPGIYGKIIMKWVINGEGKVMQATTAETQMKNANVEACLASRIKGWVFPKPKGGGIVIVNYPFVFKQSG
jgi:pSer/pThr/pTyr-binding forkhead associated (FHA) protein